jgi:nitrous oxidase accessory protein NosD
MPRDAHLIGNRILGYQKTGIELSGRLRAQVSLNRIEGLGPELLIAQNGLVLGDGVEGTVRLNVISGNAYRGEGWSSIGIYAVAANPRLTIELNEVRGNDVGVWLEMAEDARVRWNEVRDARFEPVYVHEGSALTSGNRCRAGNDRVGCQSDGV